MLPVAVYYHPDCLLHDTGPGHPECAERVERIYTALQDTAFKDCLNWHQPDLAPARWVEAVHSAEYRSFIEESSLCGRRTVDTGDTHVCEDSYRAALLAAGGAIGCVDAVFKNGYKRAFNLMRPPGHHACLEKAMGFCLFNNIAIAAHYARETYGLDRVCILDWDVHHGNGTQDIFYESPAVLFCSVHQLPLYPHSGEQHETGLEAGKHTTVNVPLPPGAEGPLYMDALETAILPAIEAFAPQLILLSAGFDAHRLDPLASMLLENRDFHALTRLAVELAERHCSGRLVSILEGGYHLEALPQSVCEHVRALSDQESIC
jgi:acetoin utilization deacetylase AcuC-like enzyme